MSLAPAVALLLFVAAALRAEGWFTAANLPDAVALIALGLAVSMLSAVAAIRARV